MSRGSEDKRVQQVGAPPTSSLKEKGALKDKIRRLRDRARQRATTDEHHVVGVIRGWIQSDPTAPNEQVKDAPP